MTNIEFLKEIEAWLSFNTEPSKEETAKLRKSIKEHLAEQLHIHAVSGRSEELKCEHQGRRTATELVEYCEDCKKILFHP